MIRDLGKNCIRRTLSLFRIVVTQEGGITYWGCVIYVDYPPLLPPPRSLRAGWDVGGGRSYGAATGASSQSS